jgi:hypothetical protein
VTPPPGWIRLQCPDPAFDRTVLLAPDAPKLTGGVGGWETTARPQQVSMTTWGGTEPFELKVQVMLDGWTAHKTREPASQEPLIRELLTAGRGDDESPPGIFTLDGIPSLPADDWVLTGAEPGDPIRRGDMHRVRDTYTLTFLEYVPPTYLQLRKGALQGAKDKTTVITVKKGDTPRRIADKRKLSSWFILRQLNPGVISKANQKLQTGIRIRVPAAQDKRHRRQHKGTTRGANR